MLRRLNLWTPRSVSLDRPRLRPNRKHMFEGRGRVLSPEGDVLWEDPDWILNALHDAGEQTVMNVFLKEQANVAKYLGLLNDGTVAETDGTMTAVTEAVTPGSNGYARIQIVNTDWTDDGLIAGDYRFSAAQKTFGPATTSTWTLTHASISTTSSTAGVLLATIALSGTTSILVGQQFQYLTRWASS